MATNGTAPPNPSTSTSETDLSRNQLRERVREAMKNGEMDAEPEITMNKSTQGDAGLQWDPDVDGSDDAGDEEAEESDHETETPLAAEITTKSKVKLKDKSKKSKKAKASKLNATAETPNLGVKGDAFFDSGEE